jgi:hypothetical protein
MTAIKVNSGWVDGSLVFSDKNANNLCILDGNNRTLDIPSGSVLVVNSNNVTSTTLKQTSWAICVDVADVSAEANYFVISPYAGNISNIHAVVDGAIGTADLVITPSINGNAVTNGAITVAYSGSGQGSNNSSAPSAARTLVVGDLIKLNFTGAGVGGTPRGHVVMRITA